MGDLKYVPRWNYICSTQDDVEGSYHVSNCLWCLFNEFEMNSVLTVNQVVLWFKIKLACTQ